jgi:nicotinamide-nucleotide amidase
MRPMLDGPVSERLATLTRGAGVYRRILRIAGRSESHVEEASQPIYSTWLTWPRPIATTILAAPGAIELHLTVVAPEAGEAEALLERAVQEVSPALGRDLYTTRGETMEEVVGALLRARGLRLAVAESCTGGLIASRITEVPGCSTYFDLGVVSYSNAQKIAILGVSADLLAEHGAVSEPVALAMARGVRARAPADIGIGVTGIAGPGGETPTKQVGTVVIATDGPGLHERVRTFRFLGAREQVRVQAAQTALDMVRRSLS